MSLSKNFLKEKLSIATIGVKRFYLGLLTGFSTSITLYLFFVVIKDSMLNAVPFEDKIILSNSEYFYSNFFLSALAVVFSFNLTMIIWLSKSKYMNLRYRVRKNLFKTNSFFGAFSTLSWVSRVAMLYGFLLSTYFLGYQHLFREFAPMLILIILYLFFQQWNYVSFNFKTGYWKSLSFIVLLSISLLYANYSPIDNERMNELHSLTTEYRYNFIDREIERAERWGLFFSEEEKFALRFEKSFHSRKAINSIIEIIENGKTQFSLKQLILHKIFIHNLYYQGFNTVPYSWRMSRIVKKIPMFISQLEKQTDKNKITLYFEILNELHLILNPKMKFTKDDFTKMNYGEALRHEAIFELSNKWPEKWEPEYLKSQEFTPQLLVQVEDVELEIISITSFNKELFQVLNNSKFSDYLSIIQNQEKIKPAK